MRCQSSKYRITNNCRFLGTGISAGVASSAVKHSGSHTSTSSPEGALEENNKMLQVLRLINNVKHFNYNCFLRKKLISVYIYIYIYIS